MALISVDHAERVGGWGRGDLLVEVFAARRPVLRLGVRRTARSGRSPGRGCSSSRRGVAGGVCRGSAGGPRWRRLSECSRREFPRRPPGRRCCFVSGSPLGRSHVDLVARQVGRCCRRSPGASCGHVVGRGSRPCFRWGVEDVGLDHVLERLFLVALHRGPAAQIGSISVMTTRLPGLAATPALADVAKPQRRRPCRRSGCRWRG